MSNEDWVRQKLEDIKDELAKHDFKYTGDLDPIVRRWQNGEVLDPWHRIAALNLIHEPFGVPAVEMVSSVRPGNPHCKKRNDLHFRMGIKDDDVFPAFDLRILKPGINSVLVGVSSIFTNDNYDPQRPRYPSLARVQQTERFLWLYCQEALKLGPLVADRELSQLKSLLLRRYQGEPEPRGICDGERLTYVHRKSEPSSSLIAIGVHPPHVKIMADD
ncbi:hypothetical protein GGTG_10542 [Gaeumannomyces tritici R3-111a-1]|uniref:Uncharacterized protein n=1 Tax=Gaeumannomyces tritici (strain R3-111a-1) TaxID=644352 RepID=J3PAL7_GAET3|nr:hypothetical protein GGTG_10542 [Gaeumannomyces tritici R3-111a-1]EJT71283.1 hypothetical protein GGTG_10542 [Gaeumannomyces tritici R3-111a-1]